MFFGKDVIYMLILGFVLDLFIGDPEDLPHPVRFIGAMVSFFEKRLNTGRKAFSLILKGSLLVILVLFSVISEAFFFLFIAHRISRWLYIAVGSVISWQCLAMKCLKTSSMKVFCELKNAESKGTVGGAPEYAPSDGNSKDIGQDDLKPARQAVSMIVGRDTESLDRSGIIRAAVESVAESCCDGVMAPLFYLFLLGPLGGLAYKAANTMDSMIGYRNERYEYFGKAAARLDDVLNFIPARLSALAMMAGAFLLRGLSGTDAVKTWLKDRNKLKSPNAGQTESVASGALKLKLAGPAYYGGVLTDKPFIGEEYGKEPETEDIIRVNRLMYLAAFLGMAFGLCVSILEYYGI